MTHDEFPTKVTAFSSTQSMDREQEGVDKETRSFEETQQANRPEPATRAEMAGQAPERQVRPLGLNKTAEEVVEEKHHK